MLKLSKNSIKGKLIRIGLLTTTMALALAFLVLLGKELLDTRNSLVSDLRVQAKTIGTHSASALIFNDPKAAVETLSTLQSWPNIRFAVIYSQEGAVFAVYQRPGLKPGAPLPSLKDEGVRFGINTLNLVQPVSFNNRIVGKIGLQSDLKKFYLLIIRYGITVAAVLILALAAAYFLLSQLHRIITTPLSNLVRLMGTISREKNYDLRAPLFEADELSALGQGFNEMLNQIQQRDRELERHRKNLEEEVSRRTKDLAMANIQLERELEERRLAEKEKNILEEQLRQSQKMEAIGRLAGGVAHDFNNLLTIIQGYCELSALKIEQREPIEEEIEQIRQAGNRASDLTRQLLAFSRRQLLEMKVVDLNELLENMKNMLSRILGEDIQIFFSLGKDLGKVKTDPGQIEQVILNLSVNARDAMPYGGKLTIETGNVLLDKSYAQNRPGVVPGPYVKMSVIDTGSGMPPEVKNRVFEPFFTTKELGKGTGLGLSTIYGIIKQSGGNIWVQSELYKGTTFDIYLPRIEEPTEEGEEAGDSPIPLQGSETILVVEDEKEVGKIIKKTLQELGYKVWLTEGGREALRFIKDQETPPIQLLITDVVMPGMSGRELRDHLIDLKPDLKVIFMSGYTDDAVIRHGISKKEMNFIQKPFSVKFLARKVRQVLDET